MTEELEVPAGLRERERPQRPLEIDVVCDLGSLVQARRRGAVNHVRHRLPELSSRGGAQPEMRNAHVAVHGVELAGIERRPVRAERGSHGHEPLGGGPLAIGPEQEGQPDPWMFPEQARDELAAQHSGRAGQKDVLRDRHGSSFRSSASPWWIRKTRASRLRLAPCN